MRFLLVLSALMMAHPSVDGFRLAAAAPQPAPAVAQAAQQAAAAMPATPAGCVQAANDAFNAGVKAARAGGALDSTRYQALTEERVRFAADCAAQFRVASAAPADLASLAELYTMARQRDFADEAIGRALETPELGADQRARVLVTAVRMVMSQPVSPARNAQAEKYVAEIDKLPNSVVMDKITAHGALNNYYRADDIDAGIIAHSTKLIELGRTLTAEQRRTAGSTLVMAYNNLAEALAGQEQTAKALEVLRQASKDLPGDERVEEVITPTLERYLLVGTPAAPIEAPRWLNAPAGTTRVDPRGSVTLIEFTAHWCGPCRESYPGVIRLSKRFTDRGFKVVMVSQLYGFLGTRRNLTPDEEVAADREYFAGHGITFPIAIADRLKPQAVDGKAERAEPVNETNYKVSGIPQIMIVDKRGIIRLIMIGYDEANEERLAGLIGRLLAE